jgi:putative membrane protein
MIDYDGRRWLRVILRVKGTVLPRIALRTAIAAGLGVLALFFETERHWHAIPGTAHALVGVALGLLLVFRTNASYDRYWEGRRLVGALINRSRDLARQVATYFDGDDATARHDRAQVIRHIALSYALVRQHVRGERDLAALGTLTTDDERKQLEPVAVRPLRGYQWITERIAEAVRSQRLSPALAQSMDANMTTMIEALGGMERILKTPVPLAYAHHIKTFVALFCFTAPFVMVDAMRNWTPVAAAVVAYGLFGIDEIGVEIEDPFGYDPNDLPLDRFGEVIERDVGATLAARDAKG